MGHLGLDFSAGNECWAELPGRAAPIRRPDTEVAAISPAEVKTGTAAEPAAPLCCPQGQDCPGGGFASRVLDCQEGCGFHGCAACMRIHESEPHSDDSATMREMVRGIGHGW